METLNGIVRERDTDIMTKLVDDRRQLQAIEEELSKAKEKNRLSTITSPIAGTVQQLAVHTVGGVVTPAQALMLIVPDGAQMEIEAWVANKDIGFIFAGQNAEIKVETFNFQKYGTLDASLVEISSDAVEDKEKGLVYRALLRTNVDNFSLATGRTVYLSPGMAVTAEIKTRQKRIIEYFMDPFIKYRSEGLRER
ncbi:MAG: HlyD family type I secretion periplasmic adaptor subunit, partial [Bacillota bacterium]